MKLALLCLLLASLPGAAAGARHQQSATRLELRVLAVEGCGGLELPAPRRVLLVSGSRAVDPGARFWVLDRARSYRANRASVRYRVGDGVLLVESELAPRAGGESIRIRAEEPIGPPYRELYLGGLELPCTRRVDYRVEDETIVSADLDGLARFDALLHQATELEYDQRFDEAEALLEEAAALVADDPASYWMRARARYLALEANASGLALQARLAAYREAEGFADRAVELAPDLAEGYLWQGVLRGRMATTRGSLRAALDGWLGRRGPAWLERTLVEAVSRPGEYRFLGFSTHGNALYALAQFYRMAPDGWYMAAVGTRGDIDRAVELSREAVATQPLRIEFHVSLAVALLCRDAEGDRASAHRQLRTVLELPAVTPVDRIDQRHARLLLRDEVPEVCGYSRDALHEVVTWSR